MAQQFLRDFTLSIPDRGIVGECPRVTPPVLQVVREDVHIAGRDAPIRLPVGIEPLVMSFEITGVNADLLSLWGLQSGDGSTVVLRGAVADESGAQSAVEIEVTGEIDKVDSGTWERRRAGTTMVEMSDITYYKRTDNGETRIEIDIPNGIRIVDGVDQLAEQRSLIGL